MGDILQIHFNSNLGSARVMAAQVMAVKDLIMINISSDFDVFDCYRSVVVLCLNLNLNLSLIILGDCISIEYDFFVLINSTFHFVSIGYSEPWQSSAFWLGHSSQLRLKVTSTISHRPD